VAGLFPVYTKKFMPPLKLIGSSFKNLPDTVS